MNHPLIEPLETRIAPAGVFTIVKEGDVLEGNSGETNLFYIVKLTGDITSTATVHFKTEVAPTATAATAGVDYIAVVDQTLTFEPGGPTEMRVPVRVIGDTENEPDEVVRGRIFSASGATLGGTFQQFANASILSDDIPTISIDDGPIPPVTEGDSGQTEAVFHVTLSNVYTSAVSVAVTVTGVTATPGSDFVIPTTTMVTFAPGVKSIDFPVQIIGDLVHENTETFSVTLSNPTGGAFLGTARVGAGTITLNNSSASTVPFISSLVKGPTEVIFRPCT